MILPQDFIDMMQKQIGSEETNKLQDAIGLPSPTSIRINPIKKCENPSDSVLAEEWNEVKWCKEGRLLNERPSFTFDPLFHCGAYYVQEASSMYLSHIIKNYIERPVVALDLCAAPGGKSTLAISTLPEGSFLIANEVNRKRCQILAENITKWGNPNTIVTNNYAEDFANFSNTFDLIICDAPCSGEGMFRKDEEAIKEWSLNNVETCWKRQQEIVSNIWHCLKPGGILIYSTCTYNHYEDEDIIEWIESELGGKRLPLCDDKDWGIKEGHFFPHHITGEGFFVCPIRKTDDDDTEDYNDYGNGKKNKKGKDAKGITAIKPNTPIAKELKGYLNDAESFTIYEEKDCYYAFPTEHISYLQEARNSLHVVHSGIKLATVKGKNLQPEHSLAMSNSLRKDAFENVELDKDNAIAYLRTEAICVDAPKGFILLTYKGIPLGFGKNIGNRVNNLYPAEWKIRKNY